MEGIKILAFAFILWGFQLNTAECRNCVVKSEVSGRIQTVSSVHVYYNCWKIPVPQNHFIHLQIQYITSEITCEEYNMTIEIAGTNDVYKYCSSDTQENPVIGFGNVTVAYNVTANSRTWFGFLLNYTIKTKECLNMNSFTCDANSCISEEKVCDGVNDCTNGEDEIRCETGVKTIKEVPEVKNNAVSWLIQKRTAFSVWKEKTFRTVVALYLASAASFNGTVLEEEWMAKQTEFKTTSDVLRPSVTNSELSMVINALLVTCHNPRQFYGRNLVKHLKDQVEDSGNLTHPLAYLTLCNADESWPLKATSDLSSILNSKSEYPFVKDLQAMAVMALSCEVNRSRNMGKALNSATLQLYKETIRHFKNLQARDGSFGNVYTTALLTQALFSSGQEHSRDWNLNATIKYLIKELNSSSVDFMTIYLSLPILNSKSLMDISFVNCSANPRKHGYDPFEDISDHLVRKIRVQYSLYIGDENPFIHTIPVIVEENSTASEVMELAEGRDRRYKFQWKTVSGKMYVYEIANVKNDAETGKFWLLYVGAANSSQPLTHLTKGPDEIVMGHGEHLVFWYKTAMFA